MMTNVRRITFADGVELAELCVCDEDEDVALAIAGATGWRPADLALLARVRNLMGNKLDPLRARNAALRVFTEGQVAAENIGSEFTDLLIKVPTAKAKMLAAYRQSHWLIASQKPNTLQRVFGPLRAAFEQGGLKEEIGTLLTSCDAVARLWTEGTDRILQVFYRSGSKAR
ncbi:MAG: hypothetical protein HXY23_08370 [Parvularculaceae bacterium]|nr:hypothetical protein [Parvularculaceae bacterium]